MESFAKRIMPEANKHKFLRAREVSWKQGTLINILPETQEKKGSAGKHFAVFFLLDTSYFLNRKFNSKMNRIKAFFPYIRTPFLILKKGQERPSYYILVAHL